MYAAIALLAPMLFACTGSRPTDLGVHGGRLLPCPGSPNCVSSDATDEAHAIEALSFEASPQVAWQALREAVEELPRAMIVQDTGDYMHIESTSLLFRYVDDLELDLRAESKRIAVRSASRLGHSDMGVNRKRVEELRTLFDAERRSE
jgi:uncharacterized protein (DUF1499 family)